MRFRASENHASASPERGAAVKGAVGLALGDRPLQPAAAARHLAAVFNSLAFPIQLLFRFVAIDLDGHAAEAEQAAANRGPELAAAGRDYAALLRHLSRTLVLLEPHVYLGVHRLR